MSGQERKLDAAEYVIGTLSAVERTAFEASIETDATTRDDVLFWERTFGALNASVAPEAPPKDLWDRISADLPGGASGEGGENSQSQAQSVSEATASTENSGPDLKVVSSNEDAKAASSAASVAAIAAAEKDANNLRRSLNRWRTWAVAASVAAVALAGVLINSPNNPLAPPAEQVAGGDLGSKEYIAVVNANGDQPSLVINIDAATGDVTVRSIGVERPEGKSLEVWYVPDGQTPISVGLVGEGSIDLKDIQAKDGDLLAISVEPPGGSPTGVATGDVIYTGKLIENVNPK
ncbi:MAG: anti-sigma factor [Rhizobiaceae bacterium]|nr:anti-sigma factor [Hyphomicrobiales bacterium]NRB32114.1 anti-sigma factor [Rhizobiaceae bacterium]